MRLKSELYPKEQEEIANKIIDILDLDDKNSIILYDLDNDETKKKQLMELIPSVRKFFAFNNIKSASDPEKMKRPYLSLIRCVTKKWYDMLSCDFRIIVDDKQVRTKKYIFYKITIS